MEQAERKLSNLRDLLHKSGLPPMTSRCDDDEPNIVLRPRTKHRVAQLVGKTVPFDEDGNIEQIPASIDLDTRIVMMNKINDMENLTWSIPLVRAKQISLTMMNRNVPKDDIKRMVHITLRATEIFRGSQGTPT